MAQSHMNLKDRMQDTENIVCSGYQSFLPFFVLENYLVQKSICLQAMPIQSPWQQISTSSIRLLSSIVRGDHRAARAMQPLCHTYSSTMDV